MKLLGVLFALALLGGAVGFFLRRRQAEDLWDAESPDGDWGMQQTNLQRAAADAS